MERKLTASFENTQDLEPQKEKSVRNSLTQIKTKLRRLYLHYTCMGSRDKVNLLTLPKFSRFLKDIQIMPQLLSAEECDIIISSEARRQKCISFEIFCEILAKLARSLAEKYQNPGDSLVMMLNNFVFPLYEF